MGTQPLTPCVDKPYLPGALQPAPPLPLPSASPSLEAEPRDSMQTKKCHFWVKAGLSSLALSSSTSPWWRCSLAVSPHKGVFEEPSPSVTMSRGLASPEQPGSQPQLARSPSASTGTNPLWVTPLPDP